MRSTALGLATALMLGCGDGDGNTRACPHTSCANPHPAGWVLPGSAAFHGTEALHVSTCVDCHDQGASVLCVACHAAGGAAGANLHSADFLATHTLDDVSANGPTTIGGGISVPCLSCHAP